MPPARNLDEPECHKPRIRVLHFAFCARCCPVRTTHPAPCTARAAQWHDAACDKEDLFLQERAAPLRCSPKPQTPQKQSCSEEESSEEEDAKPCAKKAGAKVAPSKADKTQAAAAKRTLNPEPQTLNPEP